MGNLTRWLLLLLVLPAAMLALPPFEERAHAVHGNDGFLNYVYIRSLLVGGDLDFADDCADFDALGRGYPFLLSGTPIDENTGRVVNRYGWGSSLLWAPFVIAAHVAAMITPELAADGFSLGYYFAVRFGSALWAALGLVLLLGVAHRRICEERIGPSLLAVIALVGATNLGFYIYLHPSMSTAPAFALAALVLWQIDRLSERRSSGRLFALGATMALAGVTRYGDAAFLAGLMPAVWAAQRQGRGEQAGLTLPVAAPAFIAGVFPVAVIQGLIWWRIFGSPLSGPAPYLGDDYAWTWPGHHSLAVLLSTHHGWVTWHPVVGIGLIGLVLIALDRALPLWLRLTPLAVLVQLLAVGAWPVWTGGASFGGRLMATTLAVVLFGLIAVFRRLGLRWSLALVALLTLWNLGLMAQYALEMIPRQGPVPIGEMAVNQWRLMEALIR